MAPPDRIPVGYIARAHGIAGAVIVKPLTDDPTTRFASGASFTTSDERRLEVATVAEHPAGLLITFADVRDRTAAEALCGVQLMILRASRRRLGADEFWPDQLVGCSVVSLSGDPLGSVVGVEFGDAQDRLVVATADGTRGEIPFVPELVPAVDVAGSVVTVDLPEGLLG